jgi:RHS repeat-associated protein
VLEVEVSHLRRHLDERVDHRDPAQSRFFYYDPLDRLAKTTNAADVEVEGFEYLDALGNRSEKRNAQGTTTYLPVTGKDQLASASGAETHFYAHDVYGNRIFDGPSAYGTQPTYLYNESNRLVEARDPEDDFATLGTYAYDAFGRRVKKLANGKTTLFFYDRAGHLLESVELATGKDHVRSATFLEDELVGQVIWRTAVDSAWQGLPGWPLGPIALGLGAVVALGGLALYAPPSRRSRRPRALRPLVPVALGGITLGICAGVPRMGPDFYWVHTDHLGTPLVATGAVIDPIVVWRASYSAFGEATVESNPGGYGSIVLNYRLPGQYFDAETGLHYNLLRTYDSTAGRFLEPDPVGQAGGLNVYLYASGDPVDFTDRFGLLGGADSFAGGISPLGIDALAPAVVPSVLDAAFDLFGIRGLVSSAECVFAVRDRTNRRADEGRLPSRSEAPYLTLAHCVTAAEIQRRCSSPGHPGAGVATLAAAGNRLNDLIRDLWDDDLGISRDEQLEELLEFLSEQVGLECDRSLQCDLRGEEYFEAVRACCKKRGPNL